MTEIITPSSADNTANAMLPLETGMQKTATEKIEVELLLEAIFHKYGYDFRHFCRASLKRKFVRALKDSGLPSLAHMLPDILYDPNFFNSILLELASTPREMFRDPAFFTTIRQEVAPILRTYPFLKIWHAGCSTGEEVYSMAILLYEEALKDRTQVYATDFNEIILEKAKAGIFSVADIKIYTSQYQAAGGTGSFADYYTAKYDSVVMKKMLKEKVVFSEHNLATDGVFGEMNMIFCRNVLIDYDEQLQNRVLRLFYDSLCPGGYLCVGVKESLKFSNMEHSFDPVAPKLGIYRKKLVANDFAPREGK